MHHVTVGRISTNSERVDDSQSLFTRIMEVSFQIFWSAVLNLVRNIQHFSRPLAWLWTSGASWIIRERVHRVKKKASLSGAKFLYLHPYGVLYHIVPEVHQIEGAWFGPACGCRDLTGFEKSAFDDGLDCVNKKNSAKWHLASHNYFTMEAFRRCPTCETSNKGNWNASGDARHPAHWRHRLRVDHISTVRVEIGVSRKT